MFALIKNMFSRDQGIETKADTFTVSAPVPAQGKIEPNSATWLFMENWATGEIDRLRKQNDSLKMTSERTTIVRAQISLLKKIIDLPESDKDQAGEQHIPQINY